VVWVVGASTAAPTTVAYTLAAADDGSAAAGAFGVISRAVWAKTITDLDRSTPGSTGV
jgi:hypothetical protein